MFPLVVNPIPLFFTVLTAFGVMVHDTQVDRAATVAFALPAAFATYAAVDSVMKNSDGHIHVEKTNAARVLSTVRAAVPRLQPRDDEHRYQQSKRSYSGVGERGYIWPSV